MLKDIRELDDTEISSLVHSLGEKPFRGRQLQEWLWKKGVRDFDSMSNLPAGFRESLKKHFTLAGLNIKTEQVSRDRTRKYAFQGQDGWIVEGVLIPSQGRVTACISSQVGCPLNCSFCATARLMNRRNLSAGEIFDQAVLLQEASRKSFGTHLSNLVFMGMGEPLLNYDAVMAAIYRMTAETGLGISPKRITLSTVGLTKGIAQLAREKVKFNLAVSLHSANNDKRNLLMPVNKSNPLSALSDALKLFHRETGTRITYEYLLMKDFNDGVQDARELAEFCKISPCKINLIEYNTVEGSRHQKTTPDRLEAFMDFLTSRNLVVNIRRSRGQDIDAACGQLAGKSGQAKTPQ